VIPCLFCGGDRSEPGHAARCDGQQGHVEHVEALPLLVSGLTPATRDTSEAAATSVESTRDTQRAHVLAAIRATGVQGATDDELQVALGLNGSSERPRRVELWQLGAICMQRGEDGTPRRRRTRTGRSAVVWVVPDFALSWSTPA
jgi:hypothetical protein